MSPLETGWARCDEDEEAATCKLHDEIEIAAPNKLRCTCPDNDFVFHDRIPLVERAAGYFEAASKKAKEDLNIRERSKKAIINALYDLIFNESGALARAKLTDAQRLSAADNTSSYVEALADELMKINSPEVTDIIRFFGDKKPELRRFGINDVTKEHPAEFEGVLRATQAKEPIKTYLKKLIFDALDICRIDLMTVWREKATSSPDRKAEQPGIFASALKANEYCNAFLGPDGLDPEIRDLNDIDALQDVVKTTLPVTPKFYQKFVSAIAKINLMHLAEIIRTQLDFGRMAAVTEHLRKCLAMHTVTSKKGKKNLRCSSQRNPQHSVEVASIDVSDAKDEIAIARKFINKDLEFTRKFDLAAIQDLVRFQIVLTEEDSKSFEKIEAATRKIIAILCAIFGNDISQERLRESFSTGITNENSTGKHRAFHFTFRYRNQCRSSGSNQWGTTKLDIIPVEVQIRPFLFKDQADEDHRDYKARKDAKIRRYLGIDVPYIAFINDICDAILDFGMPKVCLKTDGGYERSLKEKTVMTLFSIFTRTIAETGKPENEYTVRQICKDELLVQKIRKIAERYRERIASPLEAQKREIDEIRAAQKSEIEEVRAAQKSVIIDEILAKADDDLEAHKRYRVLALGQIKNFDEKTLQDIAISRCRARYRREKAALRGNGGNRNKKRKTLHQRFTLETERIQRMRLEELQVREVLAAEKWFAKRQKKTIPEIKRGNLAKVKDDQLLQILFNQVGGFRQRVFEAVKNVKPEQPFEMKSGLNVMAEKAGAVLDEYTQKRSDAPAPKKS